MGNPAGTSGQVISLPKGGGALHGIGEKFVPDLHTGTGNFSVPISLPPGRNGFQPQLNLTYSTGNGNGPFGLGWSLSVPGVGRKTSRGVPRYRDNAADLKDRDVFILSGVEDLVPGRAMPGEPTRYYPRTEGLFARIEHFRETPGDYWEVRTKDGLVSRYGTQRPVGAPSDWLGPAVIGDPDLRKPNHIFAWKLTCTTDPFGNRIEYSYSREENQAQNYLSEIRYADHGASDNLRFLMRVTFQYGDRPDAFSDRRAGFEIRTAKRCTGIEVFVEAAGPSPIRSYRLVYLDERGDPETLPPNGVSLLSRIEVAGHDGTRSEPLPPLEFGYTRFEPARRRFFPITGPDLPPGSLARPDCELVDLFGNGLPDVLEMNGTVRFWRNLGQGKLDRPRAMRTAPAGLRLADKGVQLIDADGDGRTDLLVTIEGLAGYYPLKFGGSWDRSSFHPFENAPSFDLKDPEVRLVDLDGDGVTDAVRSGSRLECFFNDPHKGWHRTSRVERQALEQFPNIPFSDPRVRWADMTGDGLQDIVLVHDGRVDYWPNLGNGDWGRRVVMQNSPRFPDGYDPRRILVGDVDGDGLADLIYVDDTKVTLWINRSGRSWSDRPFRIFGTPPVTDADAVRLVDLLGTGVSGVLWSADVGGLSRHSMFFLDFTGGTKPYLLNALDNHMGAVTSVEYAPSTRFYLEDEKQPQTRWQTPLPFPVQVVARVVAEDVLSGGRVTTEYGYHHGYWDGAEREFRGFGRVDQRDTEVFADRFYSPPTETRTWFHQGAAGDERTGWKETDFSMEFWPGDPQELPRPPDVTKTLTDLPAAARRDALRSLRGRTLRTELYGLDSTERQSRPYVVTEYLHGLREEHSPREEGAPPIFFPHVLAQRVTQWERGNDPLTRFTFTGDYDAYGQILSQINIAVPRGRDFRREVPPGQPGEPYLATCENMYYTGRDDAERFIVDRVARNTRYQIRDDGKAIPALLDFAEAIRRRTVKLDVIGQTLNFYDGAAFQGLDFGQVGDYGALVRTETLVLTAGILRAGYQSGATVLHPPEEPPYLAIVSAPAWGEYPPEFRSRLPALAGYSYQTSGSNSPYETGYFAATERRAYDFQPDLGKPPSRRKGRGLVRSRRDPLGNDALPRDTSVDYDTYDLLPIKIADPAGLITEAVYDYRVLQPSLVTDPNGNDTLFTFTPLGLLATLSVRGKNGQGDQGRAGLRMDYNFNAFLERGQPVHVTTTRHVHHDAEAAVQPPERDEVLVTCEFSDGFGRLLQTRTQAEDLVYGDALLGDSGLPSDQARNADAIGRQRAGNDPARVVVSGLQTYDNKGRVVEKYEPHFSAGWDYEPPKDLTSQGGGGQKVTLYYDPRGRVVRTVSPDGSEQCVVYGVPEKLASPERFTPTAWEVYTYDANDNAGRTHRAGSGGFKDHWDTPASTLIDALGRTVRTIERNGPDPAAGWHVTRSAYDIRGNVLSVIDPLDRVAFEYVYDLANRPLRTRQIDGGIRRIVLDAAGNPVEQRDNKGALVLRAFDVAGRPVRLWARDGTGQPLTLREWVVYGDGPDSGLTQAQALAANLRGRPYRHHDEAGRLTFVQYDFKGNLLEKVREVIKDEYILGPATAPPTQNSRVDWRPPPGTTLDARARALLAPTAYQTSFTYDALDRVKTMLYPKDVGGARKNLSPRYNRAGALERIELDGTVYVEHIAYNARGQRTLIAYGNRLLTRYAYDPRTFRLVRLRTEPATRHGLNYRPAGRPLQDFAYEYDLIANVTAIKDRTPEGGIPGTLLGKDALDRSFSYDPFYRLISATGRECDVPPPPPHWRDPPRCTDLTRARAYTQRYQYDRAGNLMELQHQTAGGGFTRAFAMAPNGNRLARVTTGTAAIAYAYDASGNLVQEGTTRFFEWDHSDRLRAYRTQTGNQPPSTKAIYLYDSGGQRIKKLVRKQGGQVESTVYIDGVFVHYRQTISRKTQENNTLHILDNQQRIALVRVGPPLGDAMPPVKYHLSDHLGSSNVVADGASTLVNREEYTPYGETAFGSFARKRYRFTGKERDEESGLYYHGARYYAPWLTIWASCDPDHRRRPSSLYRYCNNCPLRFVDEEGRTEGESLFTGVSKWLEITIDHIEARAAGGSPTCPDNLGFLCKSDNSSKGARPEGARLRYPPQSLANPPKSGGFLKAAQNMMERSFGETSELRNLWNKASQGGKLTYETAQAKFWELIREGTDPNAKLVGQALDPAGIKEIPGTTRFGIDPKATGLVTKGAQSVASKVGSVAASLAPAVLLAGWEAVAERNLEEAGEIRSRSSAPSAEDIEFLSKQGWKYEGVKDNSQQWSSDPTIYTRVRNVILGINRLMSPPPNYEPRPMTYENSMT